MVPGLAGNRLLSHNQSCHFIPVVRYKRDVQHAGIYEFRTAKMEMVGLAFPGIYGFIVESFTLFYPPRI